MAIMCEVNIIVCLISVVVYKQISIKGTNCKQNKLNNHSSQNKIVSTIWRLRKPVLMLLSPPPLTVVQQFIDYVRVTRQKQKLKTKHNSSALDLFLKTKKGITFQ